MFWRKKKNKPSTNSVQVIDKSSGKYKLVKTIGSPDDELELNKSANPADIPLQGRTDTTTHSLMLYALVLSKHIKIKTDITIRAFFSSFDFFKKQFITGYCFNLPLRFF